MERLGVFLRDLYANQFPIFTVNEEIIIDSINKGEETLLKGKIYLKGMINVLQEMIVRDEMFREANFLVDIIEERIKKTIKTIETMYAKLRSLQVNSISDITIEFINGLDLRQKQEIFSPFEDLHFQLSLIKADCRCHEGEILSCTRDIQLLYYSDAYIAIRWAEHSLHYLSRKLLETVNFMIKYFNEMVINYSLERVLVCVLASDWTNTL